MGKGPERLESLLTPGTLNTYLGAFQQPWAFSGCVQVDSPPCGWQQKTAAGQAPSVLTAGRIWWIRPFSCVQPVFQVRLKP